MPQTQMGVVRWVANPSIVVARILPADDGELDNPAWTKFVISGNPPLELVRLARPAIPLPNQTRIFLYGMTDPVSLGPKRTNGFPDPGNWNPLNKIEVLGAGQNGWTGVEEPIGASGGGGGGGAYATGVNVPVLSWPVPYTVWPTQGAPTSALVCVWGSTQDFGASVGMGAPGMVFAEIAYGGQNNSPGSGGSIFYPNGSRGGNGGNGFGGGTNTPGGGGGGAAGPAGAGSNGGAATATSFGSGGNANGNTTAGGFPASNNGISGIEWGSLAGCGSGGAGSINRTNAAGNGAFFGGGGGGGAVGIVSAPGPSGHGGDGLIVITYTPLPGLQAQIMS